LTRGYEGAMLRAPHGIYKFGRSTLKEGHLIKLKPFEDDEAEVIGFEEQCRNDNEATTNELGRTRRSSHKENRVPRGTLGALVLRHSTFGDFNLGTGFDSALRQEIWHNRTKYLGKLVKFRYQAIGMKDKPRIPSFLGFRHPADL
jgi:DNA ligase-1